MPPKAGNLARGDDMDAAEFANVGAELIEKSAKLAELRAQKAALDSQIALLETEIRPLVAKQAAFLKEIMGVTESPAEAPAPPPHVQNGGSAPSGNQEALKKRIKDYLKRCDPGVSATDVADVLKIDGVLVRQVMGEMARGR
jgi:chromosome segregation ATPase